MMAMDKENYFNIVFTTSYKSPVLVPFSGTKEVIYPMMVYSPSIYCLLFAKYGWQVEPSIFVASILVSVFTTNF